MAAGSFDDIDDLIKKVNETSVTETEDEIQGNGKDEQKQNDYVNREGDGNRKAKSKSKQKPKSRSELEQERLQKEEKEHEERISAIAKNISSVEEWQATLSHKYNDLYNVVQKQLPNLWPSLEFELSIVNILHIKGCTLPFAGIVLGKPSSLKTIVIEMLRKSRHTFYTDKFSSKSFVSHSTGIPVEQLVEIDLLPKTKKQVFLDS